MGITIGAMLEEIQGLYKQHYQPCFLYLSSEVIKVWIPFIKMRYFILVVIRYEWGVHLGLQIFGSDSSCANYLKILIESLFLSTTRLLTNIQVWLLEQFIAFPFLRSAFRFVDA
jgi:transportin-3